MRTVTPPSPPWLAAGLVAVLVLAGCGRPAPADEVGLGDTPDPAAGTVTEPDAQTGADPTDASGEASNTGASEGGQMTSTEATSSAPDDEMGPATESEVAQAPVATPVIITSENLGGLVDQSADRAGVRVTSSNPIVAVAPVEETTPSTVASQPGIHIVAAGDTLSVIAETYGVPVRAIAEANGLQDVDAIKPGQELIIPAP